MAFCVIFHGVIKFQDINFVTKVMLKVPVIVDHLFLFCLRILRRSYNTSFCTIDAIALLSNDILIIGFLEFLLSFVVPGLI